MASQIEGLWKGTKRSDKVIDMIFCNSFHLHEGVSSCTVISLEKHSNPTLWNLCQNTRPAKYPFQSAAFSRGLMISPLFFLPSAFLPKPWHPQLLSKRYCSGVIQSHELGSQERLDRLKFERWTKVTHSDLPLLLWPYAWVVAVPQARGCSVRLAAATHPLQVLSSMTEATVITDKKGMRHWWVLIWNSVRRRRAELTCWC